DMNEPLASVAGNAIEVAYALDHLTGKRREPRFHAVTVALGAEMLLLGGLADSLEQGRARIEHAFASGTAAERFARMVAALGGPADLLERPERHLAHSALVKPVFAETAGHVAAIDNRGVGFAVVALGGGRMRAQDAIDPAVGLSALAGLGEAVGPDRPLCLVHARDEEGFAQAQERLRRAYRISSVEVRRGALIAERIVETSRS
ncbi:MAG: thymidine phosphorylase, partial [Bosea sp. (in: a-proteobacteria)]